MADMGMVTLRDVSGKTMESEHAATWTSRASGNESGSGAVDGEALLGKEPVGPGVRELAACDRGDVVRLGGGL